MYLLKYIGLMKYLRYKESQDDKQVDLQRRKFLLNGAKILGGLGALWALLPFLSSLNPNRKVLRDNAPIKVDLSGLQPGEKLTVKWRGKPIWVLHRTEEQLQNIQKYNPILRDPDSLVDQQPKYAQNHFRSRTPRFLVLVGICTHLGCSPQLVNAKTARVAGEFYCPCHGSRFDLAGRVYKNMPAPINLEVPPYYFIDENTVVIGASHA